MLLPTFLEAGTSKKDILNDLWILKCNPTSLNQRLNMISTSKVPFKSWYFRCSEDVFKRSSVPLMVLKTGVIF